MVHELNHTVAMTYVGQGEWGVSREPSVVFTTLLGSCVSVCLFDPLATVGGMNHVLLPDKGAHDLEKGFAINSMETLINPMLKLGASKKRIVAKVFGGANFSGAMGRIGRQNVEFVLDFLDSEKILCTAKNVGGSKARRIMYWPTTGCVKLKIVNDRPIEQVKPKAAGNGLELF